MDADAGLGTPNRSPYTETAKRNSENEMRWLRESGKHRCCCVKHRAATEIVFDLAIEHRLAARTAAHHAHHTPAILELAEQRRRQMGWTDQVKQTFSAALNVLPATAAVTYILATGDPVGAAGIKVKLAGIFGLHDLYALVAIPATAGVQKADMKQLEEMLGPLAQSWLQHKLETINALFEKEVTGVLRTRADEAVHQAEQLGAGILAQLAILSKAE